VNPDERLESAELRPGTPVRRLLQGVVFGSVVGLVAFHAVLLWSHAVAGRLADPAVGLRWLASLGIVALFVVLRRSGLPLLWGRRALVLWLLVVMLHAWAARPALASALDAVSPADAAFALFVVPAAGAILGAGLVLLRVMRRRTRTTRSFRQPTGRPSRQRRPSIAHVLQRLAPRAPPLTIS
jgi:hypothetical protein